jgi:hypothetical protein
MGFWVCGNTPIRETVTDIIIYSPAVDGTLIRQAPPLELASGLSDAHTP